MILSNVFWPTFREEKLELPAQVKRFEKFTNYSKRAIKYFLVFNVICLHFYFIFIFIKSCFLFFPSSMENYTEQYKSLKGSRTLNWKPHLGLVELDLELEDRTLSFTVTPARAATIMYFQQKRELAKIE